MKVGVDIKPIFLCRPGISTFLLSLLDELAQIESRHKFVLFGPKAALREIPKLDSFSKVAVEIHQKLGKFRVPFYDQVQLPLAIRREKIDLFFCPYFDAPFFSRVPLIITVYDLVLLRFPQLYPTHFRIYFNSLLRAHLRRANRILTLSQFSKRELISRLNIAAEQICVLPYTIPPVFMRHVPPEEIEAIRGRFAIRSEYLLYTGGVDSRKNLSRLFQAVGRLNREGPPRYSLVLTGDAARYCAYEREWEKEDLGGDLVFVGFVRKEELAALYQGANLVVYPSLWEGFGLPVLEAIACGVPVATSRNSSLPEVGGDAAVYFDPQDVDDMVRTVRQALTDVDLRARLSVAARRRRCELQLNRPAQVLLRVLDEVSSKLTA